MNFSLLTEPLRAVSSEIKKYRLEVRYSDMKFSASSLERSLYFSIENMIAIFCNPNLVCCKDAQRYSLLTIFLAIIHNILINIII